ncbi:hypothetical protein CJ030_MR5G002847 [Morella rubra]|uniref:Prolyl 4-hydroxylase alpha subunit domain-containing protein n=1 Tax=Morella rubra TaxID=262757 RepID=A0A6A1VRG9_9ROSI|nr:hypothetical protein CJ030_MR5G002847 [Morella rubra]
MGNKRGHEGTSVSLCVSLDPRALYFPNFATPEQCQSIIKMLEPRLRPSAVALRPGETKEGTKGLLSPCVSLVRDIYLCYDVSIILWFTLQSTMYAVDTFLVVFKSISGVFISAAQDEIGILDFIEEKFQRRQCFPRSMLRKILRLSEDITMFQAFSVLCYAVGQLYNSHYVAFNPAEYGPQKYQRFASLLLYLSGVEDGGETVFPFEYCRCFEGLNANEVNYVVTGPTETVIILFQLLAF